MTPDIENQIGRICQDQNPFKAALAALNYTHADLASKTGISPAIIAGLVNNRARTKPAQIAALKWAITARLLNLKA